MGNGSNILYSLEDLKKEIDPIYSNYKYIGVWIVGTIIHDGHRFLYNLIQQKCDYVIGIYCNTWSKQLYEISGMKQDIALETNLDTIDELVKKTNIVMIYSNDYTSFDKPTYLKNRSEKELPESNLPKFIYKDEQNIASLRTAQAFNIMFNKYVKHHYRTGGQKDPWRFYMQQWHNKYYPYIEYELAESILDNYGNCLSSSVPSKIKEQIDKPLLLPKMRSINEVREHIKNIEGLRVVFFNYNPENKFINVRFQYKNNKNVWWNQGLKVIH